MIFNESAARTYLETTANIKEYNDLGLPSYFVRLVLAISQKRENQKHLANLDIITEDNSVGYVSENLKYISQNRLGGVSKDKVLVAINSNPDLGFEIINGQLVLKPIDLVKVLQTRNEPQIIMHYGFVQTYGTYGANGYTDQIAQVKDNGFFGLESSAVATLLHTQGEATRVGKHEVSADPVLLFIDPAILSQRRDVFSNPDILSKDEWLNKGGKRFFVFNGIPVKAIIGISEGYDKPVVLI